mgnify:CR=1 FL=1
MLERFLNNNPSLSILAGHRWQQFWEDNAQRPNEMSIQYFNDMAQVISGLLDGTTISNSYTAASWAPDAVELSSNGAKAKSIHYLNILKLIKKQLIKCKKLMFIVVVIN